MTRIDNNGYSITICDYCGEERSDVGQDGYFDEAGIKFIHYRCIWKLYENDVWKKLEKYNK
jgi:hypothetical protein